MAYVVPKADGEGESDALLSGKIAGAFGELSAGVHGAGGVVRLETAAADAEREVGSESIAGAAGRSVRANASMNRRRAR